MSATSPLPRPESAQHESLLARRTRPGIVGHPPEWALSGLGGLLLVAYGTLVWLDLPPPAGTKYAPPPAGSGLPAAHWWDKIQALRGWSVYPEGWSWALINPAPLERWLPPVVLALLGWAALTWGEQRRRRRRHVVALIMLVAVGYGMQIGMLWLKHPNANQLLLDRITNRAFTGYFSSAIQIHNPETFFVGYADAIANTGPDRLCGHCRTHSPGPILVYWVPLQVVEALPTPWQINPANLLVRVTGITPPALPPSQTIVALLGAHGILLAGALIVVPLYGLARLLAGPALALRGAALGLALPGMLLMSPEFDQAYATLAAGLLYLVLRGLRSRQHPGRWGLGAGAGFALCIYGSFGLAVLIGPLLMLLIAATLGILYAGDRTAPATMSRVPLRSAATWLAGLATGTIVPWVLLWGLGQFDLPRVLQISSHVHLEGITVYRPYGPWLLFDLVDFLQFAGLPLIAVTLGALMGRTSDRFNLYAWIFWITLLALDLAGVARAEVGRLWLFLLPLACLAVYRAVGQGRIGRQALGWLLVTQFTVALLLGGRWLTP